MRYIVAALLLASAPAFAGQAVVSWTAPTERVDGTPLDNLASYRVVWGQTSGGYIAQMQVAAPATTYTVDGLGSGAWYFAVTAIDADGLESDYSNEATKSFTTPPVPPSGLVVLEAARAAYVIVQSENRIALVPVGTVPAGTACDSAQSVRDSNGVQGYVVPKSAVVWAGSVRAEVVVAGCG